MIYTTIQLKFSRYRSENIVKLEYLVLAFAKDFFFGTSFLTLDYFFWHCISFLALYFFLDTTCIFLGTVFLFWHCISFLALYFFFGTEFLFWHCISFLALYFFFGTVFRFWHCISFLALYVE